MTFLANLKPHENFNFVFKGKLNWSKNVVEEQQAPWQYIHAANDERYCTHLSLGAWTEVFLEHSLLAQLTPYIFTFSGNVEIPCGALKSKKLVTNAYTNLFCCPEFQNDKKLGSHSIRKYGSASV